MVPFAPISLPRIQMDWYCYSYCRFLGWSWLPSEPPGGVLNEIVYLSILSVRSRSKKRDIRFRFQKILAMNHMAKQNNEKRNQYRHYNYTHSLWLDRRRSYLLFLHYCTKYCIIIFFWNEHFRNAHEYALLYVECNCSAQSDEVRSSTRLLLVAFDHDAWSSLPLALSFNSFSSARRRSQVRLEGNTWSGLPNYY